MSAFLTDNMIKPEEIVQVIESDHARAVQKRLSRTTPFTSLDVLRKCRNYIMFRLLMENGQRTGALMSITPRLISQADVRAEGAILTISYFYDYLVTFLDIDLQCFLIISFLTGGETQDWLDGPRTLCRHGTLLDLAKKKFMSGVQSNMHRTNHASHLHHSSFVRGPYRHQQNRTSTGIGGGKTLSYIENLHLKSKLHLR